MGDGQVKQDPARGAAFFISALLSSSQSASRTVWSSHWALCVFVSSCEMVRAKSLLSSSGIFPGFDPVRCFPFPTWTIFTFSYWNSCMILNIITILHFSSSNVSGASPLDEANLLCWWFAFLVNTSMTSILCFLICCSTQSWHCYLRVIFRDSKTSFLIGVTSLPL